MRINKRMCINDEALRPRPPPIEESRPRPGGELWDRKGAERHIADEANWALCSHSMEAWNVEQREGEERLPACITFDGERLSVFQTRCVNLLWWWRFV